VQTVAGPPLTIAPPDPVATPRYPNVILGEPGVVGYWRLSEPAGSGVAVDSSKGKPVAGAYSVGADPGHDGVLRLGNDALDLAARFDGVQGRVTVPFDLLHSPPTAFSIEAWVRPSTPLAQGQHVVVSSFEGGNTSRGFVLAIVKPAAGNMVARARVGDGTNTPVQFDVDLGAPTTGGWWHVVVTYRRTGAGAALDSKLRVYLNGALPPGGELPTAANPKQVDYQALQPTSTTPLVIGAQVTGSPPQPNNAFFGDVDEVALYNVELNVTQIKNHFDTAFKP